MGFITDRGNYRMPRALRTNRSSHTLSRRLLYAASALGLVLPASAWAQSAESGASTSHSFMIPAQPLEAALRNYMQQSGVQVGYESADVAGRTSAAVDSAFGDGEALSRLLSGTGLTYRFTAPTAVRLEPAPTAEQGTVQLGPVRVAGDVVTDRLPPQAALGQLPEAYPGGQVARGARVGTLGVRNDMDTPFAVTSYTSQLIADQQARGVADVLKNDPSVRPTWAEGGYQNSFLIRGFQVGSQDIAFDGVYGILPFQLASTVYAERVEILKGPSALLYGMSPGGNIGGTVNVVPKRAGDVPVTGITGTYASDSLFGGRVDIGRRFGSDDALGIRLNASYSGGNTAVDDEHQKGGVVAGAFDYRGNGIRLSADLGYQRLTFDDPVRPVYVTGTNFRIPDAPDGRLNLNQPWSRAWTRDVFALVSGEVDITSRLTAYAAIGGRNNRLLGLYQFAYLTDGSGNYNGRTFRQATWSNSRSGRAGVRGQLDTGPVSHQFAIGYDRYHARGGNLSPVVNNYASSFDNPTILPEPDVSTYLRKAPRTTIADLESVSVADTLGFAGDQVQLTLGVRRQQVVAENYNATSGALASRYDQHGWTPTFALVVKPNDQLSLYANYIQGLSQGPTAPTNVPGLTNAGEMLPPIKSKQYEIGAKLDLGRIGGTVSLFQIEQPSAYTNSSNTYALDGETRNRGIEIELHGEVATGVRLLGGGAFMDGKQTHTAGAVNDGRHAIGMPDVQINFGGEVDIPPLPGLTVSGRMLYTSKQYVEVTNAQSIPDWTRFDVGARYRVTAGSTPITFRLNVENLFDKNYWASASSLFGVTRAAPRTVLLSASVDF